MQIILFDTVERDNLFPIALTRAVAGIRMGTLTIQERWAILSGLQVFVLTVPYLQPLYEICGSGEYIFIDARIFPSNELIEEIIQLPTGYAIADEAGVVAGKMLVEAMPSLQAIPNLFKQVSSIAAKRRLTLLHEMCQLNREMIGFDFGLLTNGRATEKPDATVQLINPQNIFIEEGALVSHSILNAAEGPIYIGKNATIMEGCLVRGPFSLGEGSVIKMGSKIYGGTTLGPYCTGGGEIKNSILTGYSNKGHDGYLGDSVLGEWCNLGAGTSNSNVKNTGGEVNLWNYREKGFIKAGNKCGVVMGDYCRTAINTSINTGTVAGVCCNLFGEGLTPKFIPDFNWGAAGTIRYDFEKALKDIANWKQMKNKKTTETETQILTHIFGAFNQ